MDIEKMENHLRNTSLYNYLGKIDKIVGTTIESIGPVCNIGDVCMIEIPGETEAAYAEVVGFKENKVLLMPYDEIEGIGYGSAVKNTGHKLLIPVSNNLIGRTVDPIGFPMDNLGPINADICYGINGKKSNPMDRPRISTPIQMGIKAIDGMLTIGKGQRMGIFAGSGVGKSTLMGMIAKNVKADVNVIALVGERSREVVEFISRSRTMEQVGSIISSNSTICTGSSIWAEGGVPKSGGSRDARIIGRWIVKIYPTCIRRDYAEDGFHNISREHRSSLCKNYIYYNDSFDTGDLHRKPSIFFCPQIVPG